MAHRYIQWDKANSAAFIAAYDTAVIDESVGINYRENSAETHYLIGSSRITPGNETTLDADPGFTATFTTGEPVGWVDKYPDV